MSADQPFERAMSLDRREADLYTATIDSSWSGPVAPNGGVLAAIMVRAVEAHIGPGASAPRSISAHFLTVPAPGPVDVRVEVLRAGRRVTFCDVRMLQQGTIAVQATIVCSAARRGDSGAAPSAPPAPPPDHVPAVDSSAIPGRPPIFDRLEMRPCFGPPIFSGAAQALTGGWLSLRDDQGPLDAARLCALCDLWWPAVFASHPAPVGVPTLQLTVHLRSTAGGIGWPVLARFESRRTTEGHVDEIGELWSAGGRLLAESRQLALLAPPVGRSP